MRVIKCEQNTAEWLEIRRGKITASRICDVMAVLTRKSKNGVAGEPAAARIKYRTELMAERTTGRVPDHFVTPAMAWGHEYEGRARDAYEIAAGVMVEKVGFILHPTLDFAGASPDSLVGNNGGLEIKCPLMTTHLEWMEAGVVPEEHRDQMQFNMLCAEREWWDFMSFDPRQQEGGKVFVRRLERDEKRIAEIEEQVVSLHADVDRVIEAMGLSVYSPPARVVDTRSDYDQLMAMIDQQEMVP
jgi:putative phage-type endonuclease